MLIGNPAYCPAFAASALSHLHREGTNVEPEAEAARRAWHEAEERRLHVPVGSPAWREAVWAATLERELYRHLARERVSRDQRAIRTD
jgi:hypothetical protein